jgi:hypothetical protein
MKNMIKLPVVIVGLLLLFAGTAQKVMAQDEDISLETFYDELAPYGTWFQDAQYGYVWRPDVDQSNFRPYYTDGRWAMTEYGNTWVSDYDWGWAPFHYGRWVLNQYREWIWIPDTVWGPAWVSWRSGGGYYGWAPLSPGFDISIGFGGGYNIPNDWWVFIPQINIYNSSYPRYYYNRNRSIFNRTTYIDYKYGRSRNAYYTGPRAGDIRRVTNRDVTIYNINRSSRPGRTSISNNNINIYHGRGGSRPGNNNGFGNSGRPSFGNNGRPGQNNNRPGQPDRNNNNNNGTGRPAQPDRTNGNGNGRPDNTGRPGNNSDNGNSRPDRLTPGRDNNMQRPPENRRDGQERIQRMQGERQADQQRDNQQRQQQDQQRRQQQDQERQQREGQQRQEQQQRQQQDQQRQQQDQQRRQQQDQERQQREGQQRQEQQQRQQQDQQRQQQQQQTRPTRSEGQVQPPANTQSSRGGRGGRG